MGKIANRNKKNPTEMQIIRSIWDALECPDDSVEFKWLFSNRIISVSAKGAGLQDILDKILAGENIDIDRSVEGEITINARLDIENFCELVEECGLSGITIDSSWFDAEGNTEGNTYIKFSDGSVTMVQRGDKGEDGEQGEPGKDGKDFDIDEIDCCEIWECIKEKCDPFPPEPPDPCEDFDTSLCDSYKDLEDFLHSSMTSGVGHTPQQILDNCDEIHNKITQLLMQLFPSNYMYLVMEANAAKDAVHKYFVENDLMKFGNLGAVWDYFMLHKWNGLVSLIQTSMPEYRTCCGENFNWSGIKSGSLNFKSSSDTGLKFELDSHSRDITLTTAKQYGTQCLQTAGYDAYIASKMDEMDFINREVLQILQTKQPSSSEYKCAKNYVDNLKALVNFTE